MSEGERRLAAIMFTDMVGYTTLGQRDEALSLALVNEQRKLLRPVFNRHKGREVKTLGDGFLVLFSSALDAVRCAYDIQRTTREFNISLPIENRIHLRVGVHLGDVVEYQGDISGDAVNVASRIEALAADGGVCLSRQVYDHVQNKFDLPMTSLGTQSLKNVSQLIEVYRMEMPWAEKKAQTIPILAPENPPVEESVGAEFPLVDRTEELAVLKSLFEQSLGRRGQVVFVAGEGGVGKTRLVEELGRHARKRGAVFAVGPSYEDEAIVPYSPWIEAIRSLLRQYPGLGTSRVNTRTLNEVARIVPELAPEGKETGVKTWSMGQERTDLIVSTDIDRARLFQAITDFLIHLSTERPVVLFLDDAVWADVASIQLLHYFCRRIRDQRVIVVAAYRDVELPKQHPLTGLILDLNRERVLRQISLSRLTTDYVAELISNHLGGGEVTHEFAKLIHARTGGNPFFVEEVVRNLVEEARVQQTDRGWTLKEIGEVEIPSTVKSVIEHRVSRISEEPVNTLAIASVIGMNFTFDLLRRVTGIEEDPLIAQMEQVIHAGMLTEKRLGRELSYVFPDEQIRDYFYETLSLIRRRKIHSRIASGIEEVYNKQLDQHLDELAYHYIEAGEPAKAAEFSRKAGDHAFKLHAYPQANEHYRNVLDLIEDQHARERLDVLTKLGEASHQMGESKQATGYYAEALDLASRQKNHRTVAHLYSRLGMVAWSLESDKQKAIVYFRKGLDTLETNEESPEKAALLSDLGRLLIITGEAQEGRSHCHEALRIAQLLSIFSVQVHAIQSLALGLSRDSQHKAEILRKCEEALNLAIEHDLEEPACRAFHNLGCQFAFIKADYAKSGEILTKGVEFSKKTVDFLYEAIMQAELAVYVFLPLGEWDKAYEIANQSLRLSSEYGFKVSLSKSYMAVGVVSLCRGELDKSEEALTAAYPLVEKIQITEWAYLCHSALGRLYIEKKEYAKAEEQLLAAAEIGQHGAYISTHDSLFELVRLYTLTGNEQKASEAYQTLKSAAEDLDESWVYAYQYWAYGLVEASKGNTTEASNAFLKSCELWSQLKDRYNYARTLFDHARTLPQTKEIEKGRIMDEATRIFSQLGAKLDTRKSKSPA